MISSGCGCCAIGSANCTSGTQTYRSVFQSLFDFAAFLEITRLNLKTGFGIACPLTNRTPQRLWNCAMPSAFRSRRQLRFSQRGASRGSHRVDSHYENLFLVPLAVGPCL